MQLSLTEQEAQNLRDLLTAYLPALQREAAATDDRAFRRVLLQREELVERLLQQLRSQPS